MLYLKFVVAGFLLMVLHSCNETAAAHCSTETVKIRNEIKKGKKVTVIDQPCCKGYKRSRNRCLPVCSLDCENAKCTAPEVCTCNPGFEPLSSNRCIPHCEECDNGICTKPGYCQCHSGYTRADGGSCVAECNNCINGFCTLPNVCQCREGYEFEGLGESRSCRPVCSGGCLNGQCVAPNECLCGAGFTSDGASGECVPVSSPDPPAPRCPEGYEEAALGDGEDTCRPVCAEPCSNGTCVGPDRCECFPGFSADNSSSPYACQPVCAGGCANGECIAPGKCTCHPQYGKIGDECIPLCEKCSLGQCVQPNVCVCDRGYRLTDGDCEPICETECKNADCTGPNACTCRPGFNYTDINALFDCLPVCDEECINGQCIAPQTCQCNEGYVQDEENSCIHPVELCRQRCTNGQCRAAECFCDPGYVKNPTDGHCEKTCPHGCTNGECTGGECFCHDGYRLSSDNSSLCEPLCGEDYDYSSVGCINGRCVRPNVCQCDDGYEFVDVNQTRCESTEELARQRAEQVRMADCRRNCRNGKCHAGECRCSENYAQPEGNPLTCEPVCSEPCRNGTCTLPDTCECHVGFVFVEGSHSDCRSEEELRREANERCLSHCQNGECFNDQCICMLGYRASPEQPFDCQPVCERPCVNGSCAGNDRCHCADGFGLSDADHHLCEPICQPACVNGECVGPNECSCHSGYLSVEGTTSCKKEQTPEEKAARLRQLACERECRNGWCEEGVCRCVEGFFHEDGNTLSCAPYCERPCEAGRCVGNDTCECFERYALVEKFVCGPVCVTDCGTAAFCAKPDQCQCYDGFAMSEDKQCRPVCGTEGCTNGECVSPNECICLNGYTLDVDDPFVCHLEPKVILQSHEQSASSDYLKMSYIHYFIPVIAGVTLIVAIVVGQMIVRNRQKDYHVGKLESKENCVYFMPNPDSATDELTKLHLEIETI